MVGSRGQMPHACPWKIQESALEIWCRWCYAKAFDAVEVPWVCMQTERWICRLNTQSHVSHLFRNPETNSEGHTMECSYHSPLLRWNANGKRIQTYGNRQGTIEQNLRSLLGSQLRDNTAFLVHPLAQNEILETAIERYFRKVQTTLALEPSKRVLLTPGGVLVCSSSCCAGKYDFLQKNDAI